MFEICVYLSYLSVTLTLRDNQIQSKQIGQQNETDFCILRLKHFIVSLFFLGKRRTKERRTKNKNKLEFRLKWKCAMFFINEHQYRQMCRVNQQMLIKGKIGVRAHSYQYMYTHYTITLAHACVNVGDAQLSKYLVYFYTYMNLFSLFFGKLFESLAE